ncbi:hypothetical protein [Leifsonia poae]|uniref:hypothetical protein n=1 Tax=Leifsonia poae TaxID=110933 RepID=UPI003D67ECE5
MDFELPANELEEAELIEGTEVTVEGRDGVIVTRNSGGTYEYYKVRGEYNNAVYSVLFEDTGEVRQYLGDVLEER